MWWSGGSVGSVGGVGKGRACNNGGGVKFWKKGGGENLCMGEWVEFDGRCVGFGGVGRYVLCM